VRREGIAHQQKKLRRLIEFRSRGHLAIKIFAVATQQHNTSKEES
jgi:hypothetical protein